ncbi:hypothetical protein RG963_12710 [Methanosarcina sp. Z-7115]|uniref:Homeodomain phBC6A51-type domain-containing protein n=1 Tax=Methanosarcina baikalica TaxID=3073890 RepID=A0ABU2D3Q6_9EURY|nr:hypothetical protein [Methanosarcina sp. Z-7115]MDR7666621.1 hypothetical protein [Methanosarcina sp. Z-7115]
MTKPCRIDDDLIKTCADNIRLGLSYAACAKAIGVTYQTWHNWEKLGADGKAPYAKWYIAIRSAESDLMKECMESVKMSMRLGDVKSAMFILERRFSGDYGKVSQVNMQSQNMNLNIDASPTADEKDKIRMNILARLQPKNHMLEEA